MIPLDSPFMAEGLAMLRKAFRPVKPVRHQQTCPVCGRKLVNTYCKGGVWKCKRCWDGGASCESD